MKYNSLSFKFFHLPALACLIIGFTFTAQARVTTASSVEQGIERAAKSKKDCLIFNYGEWDVLSSDVYKNCWKNTRHLDKTLENSTVLAEATFGDDLTDAQKRAQERRNKGLKITPPSLPSVFFIDKDGFHYATLSGTKLPAEETRFADTVAEIQKIRIQRDEMIKDAMLKKGVERANALGAAGDLEGIKTSPKILELVRAADPNDESGYIRRLSFDIFKLHGLLKESDEKAHEELDKLIADEGYSIEQRQMMLGLKNFIYRKNPAVNEKNILDTYTKMYKLGPETVMGRSGLKGLQESFNIYALTSSILDKPVEEALKELDKMIDGDSFPFSVSQKQTLLELRARCMSGRTDDYKDEIIKTYRKLIELNPKSALASFAEQEIDFLTLTPEQLAQRKRLEREEMQDDIMLGEEIFPDDDDD